VEHDVDGVPVPGDPEGCRTVFVGRGLDLGDLDPDPVVQFRRWFAVARRAGVHQPEAMALATVGADGWPSVRHVLLRDVDDRGLVFYTNRTSPKAADLEATGRASVVFPWLQLDRQVRVTGGVTPVGDGESDAYFATRPRGSQLGAWASAQSAVLTDRAELERRVAQAEERFAGRGVPRPPHWGGYRLVPVAWEVWQGRPDRLHDRFRYRPSDGGGWIVERLSP
jgi:pyridoxamine 5'-phosphate oxidase